MKIDILASGSSGNCIAARTDETTILIDIGIPKTKIEKKLLDVGIRPDSIAAIFITHAHKDHVKGLPLANKYRIPVYAGEEEYRTLNEMVSPEIAYYVEALEEIAFRDMTVQAFNTHHDAFRPLGYTVTNNNSKASICLDTGHVDDEMIEIMKGSDIYVIEANHQVSMVEASSYPDRLKGRILSDIGHLSNEQTGNALCELIEGRKEKIYLTHLSSTNNLPALAELTIQKILKTKGLRKDLDYEIEVF